MLTLSSIRRLGRLAAIVIAVALVAAACSDDNGAGSSGTSDAAGGEIDRDARLIYATTNPLQSLDPHVAVSPSTGSMPYLEPVCDRLVGLGPGLTLEPMLATGWEYAEDGMSVTFELRDDAMFSDGARLTADAVKASIDRLLTIEGAPEAGLLASVESVEVVDELTVRFNLSTPDAAIPARMAQAAGIVLSPAAIDDPALAENPTCIGPYQVTEFSAGERVRYERAAEYWNPDVQNFAEIEIRFIVDDNARLNALQSGEIDIAYVSSAQIEEARALAERDDFDLQTAPAWGYEFVWLNLDNVPDPVVREAMMLAIDRESINEGLFGGDCEPTVQPHGPDQLGHVPDLEETYAYDPDRARELLEGGTGSTALQLLGLASSPNREMALAIEEQLEQVGFDISVSSGDSAAQFGSFAQGEGDGIVISASAPLYEGEVVESSFLALSKAQDHASEDFLGSYQQAYDPTLSDDALGEVVETANRAYTEEFLSIPICRTGIKAAYASNVTGVEDMRWPTSRRVHDVRYLAKMAG